MDSPNLNSSVIPAVQSTLIFADSVTVLLDYINLDACSMTTGDNLRVTKSLHNLFDRGYSPPFSVPLTETLQFLLRLQNLFRNRSNDYHVLMNFCSILKSHVSGDDKLCTILAWP